MSYGKRIVKGSMTLFLFTILAAAVGYGTRIFLARNLSTAEFGLFYAVSVFMGIFWVIKDHGYSASITKYIPHWIAKKKSSHARSLVWFGVAVEVVIGIVIFLLLFFGSEFLASAFFRNTDAVLVIQVLAAELLVGVVLWKYVLLGFKKIVPYSSVDMMRNILLFVFVVPFVALGAYGIAISYLLVSLIIQAFLMYYIFSRLFPAKPALRFRGPEKAALRFGLISFASAAAGYIISYADTVFLTGLKGLTDVGLYQAAVPTSQLLWIFATSVTVVMMPYFSEMWARNQKTTLISGLELAVKIMMLLMLAPILMVAIWPELVLTTLFGAAFISAAPALQILAFGSFFYSLMMLLNTTLSAVGKPGASTKTLIMAAVANLIFNVALIPPFGIAGAALAVTISYTVGFVAASVFIRKNLGVSYPWAAIGKVLLSAIASLIVMSTTKGAVYMEVVPEVLLTLFVGFVVYAFLVRTLRVWNSKDLDSLESMGIRIPQKIRRFL